MPLPPRAKNPLTPVQAVARGAAAGLAATIVLSALSRVLPGLWDERSTPDPKHDSSLPDDSFDAESVREWQERAQAPAAFDPPALPDPRSGPPAAQPAGALTLRQGPGPEGLAEQFAFKVASGVFNRDISQQARPVGLATHLTYGSSWGAVYGVLQSSYQFTPGGFGPLFGLVVYGVGPACLVPAMKLMGRPSDEPPARTGMLVFGHLVYGAVVAGVFRALERRE